MQKRLQLVVCQIKGEFKLKEPLLQRCYHTVSNLIAHFKRVTMEHIRKEDNMKVETLSLLATTKNSYHRSVVQIYVRHYSVEEAECLA